MPTIQHKSMSLIYFTSFFFENLELRHASWVRVHLVADFSFRCKLSYIYHFNQVLQFIFALTKIAEGA